jgi:hypothetical protein
MTTSGGSDIPDPVAILDHAAGLLDRYERGDIEQTQRAFFDELNIPHEAWQTLVKPKAESMGKIFAREAGLPEPFGALLGAACIVAMGEGFMLGVTWHVCNEAAARDDA